MKQLIAFKDKQLIKVISGIHRCGKLKIDSVFCRATLKTMIFERIIDKNRVLYTLQIMIKTTQK